MGMAGLNFSTLPFQVAAEKGFYRKHGLKVEQVLMRANVAIPALISGDIDYTAHFGSIVRGAVRGMDIRLVFSTAEKQMFSLVVQPSIREIADLKGKIVGISSFGGTQHRVTLGILRAMRINPDKDLKIIPAGDEHLRVEQLRVKKLDASMINPPHSILLRKEGFRLLLHAADYSDLPLAGSGTTTTKIRENPEQVKRLLRALYEALQFVRNKRKESIDILARWLKMDASIAAETYNVSVKILSRDGAATDKAILASIQEAKEAGNLAGNFSPRDVSDFSLLKEVIKEHEQKR